jgi:hypothetical protein
MRTLRRLWRSDAAFYALVALMLGAILRSAAEHQSPAEALLWILVILVGLILMVDGLARGYPQDNGSVVPGWKPRRSDDQ